MLKGQQNLVCFNCRRGILTAKLWLTCAARLLLFSWGNSRGPVRNLFLNCCHHVTAIANFFCNSCYHVVAFCSSCHHVRTVVSLFYNSCHHVRLVVSLFYNSCHHERTNFTARVLCILSAEEACFRIRVTHGVVFIRSLVIHVCVSECFRNGSGVHPYLLVQTEETRLI